MSETAVYRGRFAPSPTGPLHFGSLLAAMASYCDARCRKGQWLLRMEDLDPPRERPGAATAILDTLRAFGFVWDGELVYQSQRTERYAAALQTLQAKGLAYPCGCTRAELAGAPLSANGEAIYPGTCRDGLPPGKKARAWRFRVGDACVQFEDLLQGRQEQDLAPEVGDFVIRRADGWFAYHLAVVVDDAAQGITEIVRGADLLPSTPRQIQLQRTLNLPTPRYLHIPVAINSKGEKLSKQTLAPALNTDHPMPELLRAWIFLGQESLPEGMLLDEFWPWAFKHWRREALPRHLVYPSAV